MNAELKAWYEAFMSTPTAPMTEGFAESFVRLVMAELHGCDEIEEIKEVFEYKVIDKRAEYIGLNINFWAKALITSLSGNPAEAVMYLTAMRIKQLESGSQDTLTVSDMTDIFPNGFPKSLEELWDMQKNGSENMLDNVDWG